MPETIHDRTIFSLAELATGIQRTMTERFPGSYWIKAELNKLNRYPHSGHCYPDLVDKSNGKVVAEMRATIWKDDFERINGSFLRLLNEPLKDGIRILFCARIQFHPVYGLSLRITDIDPSWSLGELEKEKQLTIETLKKEGVYQVNRSLELPLLVSRVAVISVETSKGYADFRSKIDQNEWGYRLFHMLFPALLQGDQAVAEILGQLDRIDKVRQHFDAVAIIRGGGGEVGLSCFNQLPLARAVALFPLPVLTGIGHSTNETVVEMVACLNAITPTELADQLIRRFQEFESRLVRGTEIIAAQATRVMNHERRVLGETGRLCRSVVTSWLGRERDGLDRYAGELHRSAAHAILLQRHHLETRENTVALLDPMNVLRRGYSITLNGDKLVRSADQVKAGDVLQTILPDGVLTSVTEKIKKS